jgi:hypothetical protein
MNIPRKQPARATTLSLIVIIIILPLGNARAQTRAQCETVAPAIPPLIASVGGATKQISTMDWGAVSRASSGQFRTASEAARVAQENLAVALKQYLAALQDVTYQGQLCAR